MKAGKEVRFSRGRVGKRIGDTVILPDRREVKPDYENPGTVKVFRVSSGQAFETNWGEKRNHDIEKLLTGDNIIFLHKVKRV